MIQDRSIPETKTSSDRVLSGIAYYNKEANNTTVKQKIIHILAVVRNASCQWVKVHSHLTAGPRIARIDISIESAI